MSLIQWSELTCLSLGVIEEIWHGWHAFRRGLGTRLNEFGVDTETIQTILRHSDISTTQAYYILPNRTKTEAAMKRMGVWTPCWKNTASGRKVDEGASSSTVRAGGS